MLNVKNIIKSASTMLGIDELLDMSNVDNLDENSKKLLDILLYCFNEVYQELCCDYFPLVIEEKVNLNENCFYFDDLDKDISRLYTITDTNRNILKYEVYSKYVRLNESTKEIIVRYSYLPNLAQSVNDEVECSDLGVTERMVALGVVSEFCLIRGKLNEASIYDRRYKDCIESAKIPTKRMYLKSRLWM